MQTPRSGVSTDNQLGCLLAIARAIASLVLGVIVFVGMLYFVVLSSLSVKLLDAEFYTGILRDTDSYNRVYAEAAREIHAETHQDLGGIQVVSPDDTAALLREIMPPDYLQSQAEGAIGRTISYLREETGELEAYIELGPPLDRVRPALFGYIDRRIDQLEEVDSGAADCSQGAVRRLADGYNDRYRQLADGEIPTTVPSLKSLTRPCRALVFEAVYEGLADARRRDPQGIYPLGDYREELRQAFYAGDTHTAMKVMARPLSSPRIDDAVEEIRRELATRDRLDLVHELAKQDESTEQEIRDELDDFRGQLNLVNGMGKTLALVVVIVGSVVLGLLYLPNPVGVARWPGITLLLSGVICLLVGQVLQSRVPGWLESAMAQETGELSSSAAALATDLATTAGSQLATGFTTPAVTLIVVGGLLFASSFLLRFRGGLDRGGR